METVARQNGVVTGYKSGRLVQEGVVMVESECQMYDGTSAEHLHLASLINVGAMSGPVFSSSPCPVPVEDHVTLPGALLESKYVVTVDKKALCVAVRKRASGHVHKLIQLSGRACKILHSDTAGCIDFDPTSQKLLLSIVPKREFKDKEYDELKFIFKDTLGETLDDISEIQLLLIDVESGEVQEVETGGLMPVKAASAANGDIVFLALNIEALPRIPGLVYCSNKPVGLFVKRISGAIQTLSALACRSIVMSKSRKKVAYLRGPLNGAHFQACDLVIHDLVDGQERVLKSGLFVGSVFGMNIPDQQWTYSLYLNIQEGFYSKIMRIGVIDGQSEIISYGDESWSIVSVFSGLDLVLAQHSTILSPPLLGIFKEGRLVARQANEPNALPGKRELLRIHEHCEALLVQPERTCGKVILMPHGGPNSAYLDEYLPFLAGLLNAGFALCRVNYTGSSGYGSESIDKLIKESKVGIADVEDCMRVHEVLKRTFGTIHVLGGSHGGYLAAMLSSQYPEAFSKCVMLNPVIAMYANCVSSDIADYVFENLGIEYLGGSRPPSVEDLRLFHERSPRPTSKNPPTLVVVGGVDRRVPAFNGLAWHGWLKALGVQSRCLYFPECNHALSSPEADRNLQVAVLNFLQ